MLKVKGENKK